MAGRKSGSAARIGLLAAAIACAVYALTVGLSGGFDLRFAGIRVRSHSWIRPALASIMAAATLGWLERERVATLSVAAWRSLSSTAGTRALAGVALAWTLAAGLLFGPVAIGGSDSFGYASQARLLAHGRLTDVIPVRPEFSWPDAARTLIPLGYRHGRDAGVMVPTYPPGLPLLMAPVTPWDRGVYLIVPAFGLVAVWLTFRLGVAMGEPLAGALAAALLSVSPIFLFQIFQPMSDVPAAACWLAALVLSSRGARSDAAAAGAGGMASVAILIRPNLAPLACLLLIPIVFSPTARGAPEAPAGDARSPRWRPVALFIAGALPAMVGLGWIQYVRYGSPLASGYGTIQDGFAVANIGPNLSRYPRWLTETHTWFIWLWVVAPLLGGRRRRSPGRVLEWTAAAMCVAVWASYLPYTYFQSHEWPYIRFLLPALPIMLFFVILSTQRLVARAPLWLRAPALVALLVIMGSGLLRFGVTYDIFSMRNHERRYRQAGEFVRDRLPASAFVLSMQHSGSVRYYADRPTLRWDHFDPSRLDEILAILRATGFAPYAVLDQEEVSQFRRRFETAGQRSIQRLSPLAVFGDAFVFAFE